MPIRIAAGTSSRSNPSCFAPSSTSRNVTPVALPPGRAKLLTSPSSWVIGDTEYEWDRGGGCLGRQRRRGPTGGDNDCHLPAHEVCRHGGQAVIPTLDPLGVDRDCAAFMIAGFIEMLAEYGHDLRAGGARP